MIHILYPAVLWAFCYVAHLFIFRRISSPANNFGLIALLLVLSFSREELASGDFINYRIGFEFEEWNLYYAKEFVFWGIAFWFRDLFNSFNLAVYAMDGFIALGLFSVFSLPESKSFYRNILLSLALFLSFPVLMGFSNVYRQLAGLTFCLLALQWHFKNLKPRLAVHLIFILAALTHNVFICFYGLFLTNLCIKRPKVKFLLTLFGVLLVALADKYVLRDLSDTIGLYGLESGADTRIILVAMNVAVLVLYSTLQTLDSRCQAVSALVSNIDKYYLQIVSLYISLSILFDYFSESTFERLQTLCFTISIYLLALKYSALRRSTIGHGPFLTSLVVLSVLPSFTVDSAIGLIFPKLAASN